MPYVSQVLDDVFASSGSQELGDSSNMISEDEGDANFRRPGGCRAVLTDSESELDGKCSRNSSRSASFDQDSGGSEPDDVDLGPGHFSDDGSHSSRQSSSPSPPPTMPTAHLDVCQMLIRLMLSLVANSCLCKFMTQILFWSTLILSSQFQAIKKNVKSKKKKKISQNNPVLGH